ncbi:hypothetical protein BB560_006587 [Smittium megazygosporum]|uniref:Polyadenylate-binding protein n=1 Tax=Smittium megazygosporum TaxID=133381 RepID=A0A2T9Y3L0_9FUNG|nr:hypothetical protein BB560_007248 [Smittium megazygosporum]PVU86893.1 hypothetical protein BB560_006587 [Smittium megazygosporum]
MTDTMPVVDSSIPSETISQVSSTVPAPSEHFSGAVPIIPFPSASLYVGELDESVTEAMLFELFSMAGAVSSIRVCRDTLTRRSLGYAYVNFHSRADGQRAIDTLNYTEIKGRPCRIMWSQRDPSVRRSGEGNIFIKNLDLAIDNKALHDTFTSFGNILSCKVAVDAEGNSLGYGFVHYETREAGALAIEKVNGMLLNDKQVFVGFHISRRDRLSKVEEMRNKFTNVFVKNLDATTSEKELDELFSKFGEITSIAIQKDANDSSRGFGFVNYLEHESAAKAVEALHDFEFKGRNLFVSRAQKRIEREEELRRRYEQQRIEKINKTQGVNLYIKNFGDDVDDEKLRNEFAVYGVITSAKVMVDENGKSKGFGFVCFSSPDEATKAVSEMNNRMWGNKPIYVAIAQRKEQRRSHLEAISRQMRVSGQMNGINPGMYNGNPMYFPGGQSYPQQRAVNFNPNIQRPMRWAPGQPSHPQGYPSINHMGGQYGMNGPFHSNSGNRGARSRGGRHTSRAGYQNSGPNGRGGSVNNRSFNRNGRVQNPHSSKSDLASEFADLSLNPSTAEDATGESIPQSDETSQFVLPTEDVDDSSEELKSQLGEALYHIISKTSEEQAGKITGMLLEMGNSEIVKLLRDEEALNAKITEALEVLDQSKTEENQE